MPDPNSQPGIFNAIDMWDLTYGMVAGDSHPATAQKNARALQAAINAAQSTAPNPNGAIVLIPSYSGTVDAPVYGPYYIDTSGVMAGMITIPIMDGQSAPLLIMGTGEGTELIVQSPAGSTLFEINDNSFVTFQDLTITNAVPEETDSAIAFNIATATSEGCKLFRVNIVDYPNAIVVAQGIVFTTVLQCSILYDDNYAGADCIAITDSGAETNIEQCSLIVDGAIADSMIGIQIVGSSYARVTDTQVSGFITGIQLGPSASDTGIANGASFTGLDVEAIGSGVVIEYHVYDACFVNCTFSSIVSSGTPASAGINIGGGGKANDHYDTIRFTGCTVTGFELGGIVITAGQNIQVNGGTYSGNTAAGIAILGGVEAVQITGANCIGTSNADATQEYGIYATGGQDIQIIGANCSGNTAAGIEIAGSTESPVTDVRIVGAICTGGSDAQPVGIAAAGCSGILIDGCTLTQNQLWSLTLTSVQNVTVTACDLYSSESGAQGISVSGTSGSPTQYVFIRSCNAAQWGDYGSIDATFLVVGSDVLNLEVTDCAGYNDQGAVLVNGTSAPSGSFSSVIYGYYGPTAFYLASTSTGTTVKIDGNGTGLTSGGFTLAPGESAEIGSGMIIHFLMVGK
jgi:hypothetical protein